MEIESSFLSLLVVLQKWESLTLAASVLNHCTLERGEPVRIGVVVILQGLAILC